VRLLTTPAQLISSNLALVEGGNGSITLLFFKMMGAMVE
jgi:hypothetical protein